MTVVPSASGVSMTNAEATFANDLPSPAPWIVPDASGVSSSSVVGETPDAALRGGANFGEAHEGVPQALAINALVGL